VARSASSSWSTSSFCCSSSSLTRDEIRPNVASFDLSPKPLRPSLDHLPTIAAAAAATGDLSAPQLAALTDAATADPAAAPRLLGLAARASLGELRDECRRTAAAADHDLEARHARIHAARSLRTWTDPDGTANLHLRDNPERIAEITTALTPDHDTLFRAARAAGRRERPDTLAADALLTLLRRAAAATSTQPATPGAPATTRRPRSAAKVLVRVDFDTLLRGYPVGDEVCEVAGSDPAVWIETTGCPGPRAASPSSTSSTGSAPTTTPSKPAGTGPSPPATAPDPSSHQKTPDTPTTPTPP
jgi:hypothetical protein